MPFIKKARAGDQKALRKLITFRDYHATNGDGNGGMKKNDELVVRVATSLIPRVKKIQGQVEQDHG